MSSKVKSEESEAELKLKKKSPKYNFKRTWQLLAMLILPVTFLLIFSYGPMYGVLMAFQDFRPTRGILNSTWVGFKHFKRFFEHPMCWPVIRNTLVISLYGIIVRFPCAIMLALGLNYCKNRIFQKSVQSIAYFPYFISVIILIGILNNLFHPVMGSLGKIIYKLTGTNILSDPKAFSSLYVWSGVWQSVGYNAVIYIAALSAVDMEVHEAAKIDGATIMQRIWFVDIPVLLPTVVIMLILSVGSILGVGYEKAFAMQNAGNMTTSEIISTFSYRITFMGEKIDFSYGAAIGLFQSFIGLILVLGTNFISNKLSGSGLW